jgi:hypothetical protein
MVSVDGLRVARRTLASAAMLFALSHFKRSGVMKQAVMILGLVLTGVTASADHWSQRVTANLEGLSEVPAVSSPARGRFRATVREDSVEYELTFSGLQAPITQSHIHFAQPNVNGGIVVWLCGTTALPGPTGTQMCPESGKISGTITKDNVLPQAAQGIAAGEFEEFVFALLNGYAYANIHTSQSTGGEIRGQIEVVERGGKRGRDDDDRRGKDDRGKDDRGKDDRGGRDDWER